MTPKEKAKELFDFYYKFQEDDSFDSMDANTKMCCNKVVDEITVVLFENDMRPATELMSVKFWREVKEEIEKL